MWCLKFENSCTVGKNEETFRRRQRLLNITFYFSRHRQFAVSMFFHQTLIFWKIGTIACTQKKDGGWYLSFQTMSFMQKSDEWISKITFTYSQQKDTKGFKTAFISRSSTFLASGPVFSTFVHLQGSKQPIFPKLSP